MSIATPDNAYALDETNPTQLAPGTLIYLWAPGTTPWADGAKPIAARVKVARRDRIEGVDLRDGAEAWYEVGKDFTNPTALRWTWEVMGPPQRPTACKNIEIVDAPADRAARTRLIAGEPGDQLKVSLSSGEVLHGNLTTLLMGQDQWEAEWAELVDNVPGRDAQVHVIRVSEIAKITRTRRA